MSYCVQGNSIDAEIQHLSPEMAIAGTFVLGEDGIYKPYSVGEARFLAVYQETAYSVRPDVV